MSGLKSENVDIPAPLKSFTIELQMKPSVVLRLANRLFLRMSLEGYFYYDKVQASALALTNEIHHALLFW